MNIVIIIIIFIIFIIIIFMSCLKNNRIISRVRLMCALRAHIKLYIFRNIFSGTEKAVITFSILEKIFSKNGN